MDDQTRGNPKESPDLKDLPPRNADEDFAAEVKGGVGPVDALKSPLPNGPVDGVKSPTPYIPVDGSR